MSRKSAKPSAEEIALFRQATAGVRRLKAPDKHVFLPSPVPARQRRQLLETASHQHRDEFSDDFEPHQGGSTNEYLDFSRPGMQKKVLRRFRQGRIRIEAELDLHGYTINQARQQLGYFLDHSRRDAQCCVRVIHGKGLSSENGRGVLKAKVGQWLQQHPAVLAFCSAQIADGGSGAVYVLLRKA